MLLEQDLQDIAVQYSFVKQPVMFIENEMFGEQPTNNEFIGDFKATEIYKKLSFNVDDDTITFNKKQDFVRAYVDMLKTAGLAIVSTILSDIDNIFTTAKKNEVYNRIYEYFNKMEYFDKIQAYLPSNESPIDKISFIISQSNLESKYLESLRNLQTFFFDIAKVNQDRMRSVNVDFINYQDYCFKAVSNWIVPYFIKSNEKASQAVSIIYGNDEAPEAKPKKMPTSAHLSIDEAIEKNFSHLIGLGYVKSIIAQKMKLMMKAPNKMIDCNFILVGNPGVGKTTVAEAMSKTFFDAGMIKNPQFVQLNGAGLKGKYVGHTVGQVKAIFNKAKNGTLFLDEVYSLMSPNGNDDAFTQEAITQLMIEIEELYKEQEKNPNSRTLVIMAGYKDKLSELLRQNVGFARRFPNAIDIKDYTVEELVEIYNMLMRKDQFTMSASAEKKLLEILKENKEKPNFSNAGFVRNLLQRAEEHQAGRTDMSDLTIDSIDLDYANKNDLEEETIKLGFGTKI